MTIAFLNSILEVKCYGKPWSQGLGAGGGEGGKDRSLFLPFWNRYVCSKTKFTRLISSTSGIAHQCFCFYYIYIAGRVMPSTIEDLLPYGGFSPKLCRFGHQQDIGFLDQNPHPPYITIFGSVFGGVYVSVCMFACVCVGLCVSNCILVLTFSGEHVFRRRAILD